MSHFGDFMDGVPVKISEKYKRPPLIELPYSVSECSSRARRVVDNVNHCFTFESNVLSKLKELRSAKETKKNERRHRLRLLEEAKQKKMDAIAAVEAEEKLKQLSVSEVSYPSTEEISALSPDEKNEVNCDIPEQNSSNSGERVTNISYPSCNNEIDSQLNVLQPIQAQPIYHHHNLLEDPDPLQELKLSAKIVKVPQYSNVDTMTFRDFENDTSSPFDNVELKTINDMELLAQVLQSQKNSSTSCYPQAVYLPEQTYTSFPNCASQAQIEGMPYLPNTFMEQSVQGPDIAYSAPTYPNGYYIPAENICDNTTPMNNPIYMPNYQYYVSPEPYHIDPSCYNNQLPTNSENNQFTEPSYIPQPYYFYSQMSPQCPTTQTSYPNPNTPNPNQNDKHVNTPSTGKSRSRSVPDIVKELNDELVSMKLKNNERSYNASPAPKALLQNDQERKDTIKSKKKSEQLENPYDKLSPEQQSMCLKIHGMGFPLDRVARICNFVGINDKKVIEGLLILGDLMDLGFSEGKVLRVLAKNEFNRDRTLDELVS